MKKFFIVAVAIFLALGLGAQNKSIYNPKSGDFAIGVTFNPLAIQNHDYQPDANAWSGDFVKGLGGTPKQMFILSTDPLVSFMINYHFSDVVSLRANLGVTGSNVNYREYVRDAVIQSENSSIYDFVTDQMSSKLNGTTLGVGLEFTKTFGRLAFVGGFGVQYAMGGGALTFKYGNPMTKATTGNGSSLPATMSYMDYTKPESLNEWNTIKKEFTNLQLGYESDDKLIGRPTKRYNVGMNQGIGITANMGLEYFFAGRMSISAAVTFVPIMVVFQPQTKTTYEIYSYKKNTTTTWDRAYVSPGSTALLYGTQNLGLRFAFKYYL